MVRRAKQNRIWRDFHGEVCTYVLHTVIILQTCARYWEFFFSQGEPGDETVDSAELNVEFGKREQR